MDKAALADSPLPEASPSPGETFLNAALVRVLAFETVLLALFFAWVQGALPLPGAGWMDAATLPLALCATAVLGVLFFAPFVVNERSADAAVLYAAFWPAVLLFFFLRLSSRLSPLPFAPCVEAGALFFFFALSLLQTARAWPRAFAGIAFGWVVALPVLAYFFAELTLIGTGGVGWAQQSGPAVEPIKSVVRALLQLSPFPAIFGALNGRLFDGSEALVGWLCAVLLALNAGIRFSARRT
jgi:hypothetical protein